MNIYILGEHGDTQFPVWSHGNIGGLKISEWLNQHPEFSDSDLIELSENVKNAAYEIIHYKGSTHYGIAISLAKGLQKRFCWMKILFFQSRYIWRVNIIVRMFVLVLMLF